MKRNVLLFPAFLLVSVHSAQSQPILALPSETSRHMVSVTLALEPELVMLLGYTRKLGPLNCRSAFNVGGGVKVPTTVFSNGAWRMHLIASGYRVSTDNWGATFASQFYVAHNKNRAGEIHGLGVELRAAPGFYGSRRIAALDLGWQATLFSHIRHSAETKGTFQGRYPSGMLETGPVDGWYGSTAHRFRIGLVGASKLSDGLALQVALGSLFALQKQGVFLGFDLAQLPFYLETSLSFDR